MKRRASTDAEPELGSRKRSATGSLPADITSHSTPEGKAYWHDALTGITHWGEPPFSLPDATELPSHFTKYETADGRAYYHDSRSNKTQWTLPTSVLPNSANSPPQSLKISLGDNGGTITIKLDAANAPETAATFAQLARQGATGRLHRAEAVPADGNGPPYALVQTSVVDPDGRLKTLGHEGSKCVRRGDVATIGKTNDFFISLAAHPGWEKSMTVFGTVEENFIQSKVEGILKRPLHNNRHPKHGTVMAMLDNPLKVRFHL